MEKINGYVLKEPFQNRDAGFSRWTFGIKNRGEYFIKEFMSPVFPMDPSITGNIRLGKIEECQTFEKDRTKLYKAINEASDGSLVRIEEFFRNDSHYYIATKKIDAIKISMEEMPKLQLEERMLICLSLAHGILKLHEHGIVHSDLKASNVLVTRVNKARCVGRVIDFDCSFFESHPPEYEDELGGDQVYLSPEACLFICGEEATLSCKMDVFSLGILFHQYLTGEMPIYNRNEYDYLHEAVLDDARVEVSDKIPLNMKILIKWMLEGDPEQRCDMETVYKTIYQEAYGIMPVIKKDAVNAGEDKPKEPLPKTTIKQSYFYAAGDL